MIGPHQAFIFVKTNGKKYQALYNVFFLIFFWSLFDGIAGYVTPLLITEHGFSKTMMGLIIGTSSAFGAVFDFWLCSVFQNVKYRRIFLLMLLVCLTYPFILWGATTVWMFVLAMAIWGLYFDLFNFGRFNFVGKHMEENNHAFGFGILSTARSMAIVVAPIVAGLLVADTVGKNSAIAAAFFLGLAFVFLFFSYHSSSTKTLVEPKTSLCRLSIKDELKLWRRLGKVIYPVMVFSIFMNVVDGFFWTLGPILGLDFSASASSGTFLAVYSLPALLVGWFMGSITKGLGKKRTAFYSCILASLFLLFFPLIKHWSVVVAITFISSFFLAIAWPAINGVYADFIYEKPNLEKEIEGLGDAANNIGYVIGPALAGFLSDATSSAGAFAILGGLGLILSLFLLLVTPRHIEIK